MIKFLLWCILLVLCWPLALLALLLLLNVALPQELVLGLYRTADLFVLPCRLAADGDRDGDRGGDYRRFFSVDVNREPRAESRQVTTLEDAEVEVMLLGDDGDQLAGEASVVVGEVDSGEPSQRVPGQRREVVAGARRTGGVLGEVEVREHLSIVAVPPASIIQIARARAASSWRIDGSADGSADGPDDAGRVAGVPDFPEAPAISFARAALAFFTANAPSRFPALLAFSCRPASA